MEREQNNRRVKRCKCGCPEKDHRLARSAGDRRQCLGGYCLCNHYVPADEAFVAEPSGQHSRCIGAAVEAVRAAVIEREVEPLQSENVRIRALNRSCHDALDEARARIAQLEAQVEGMKLAGESMLANYQQAVVDAERFERESKRKDETIQLWRSDFEKSSDMWKNELETRQEWQQKYVHAQQIVAGVSSENTDLRKALAGWCQHSWNCFRLDHAEETCNCGLDAARALLQQEERKA